MAPQSFFIRWYSCAVRCVIGLWIWIDVIGLLVMCVIGLLVMCVIGLLVMCVIGLLR